ncbi:hypothetical protein IN07_03755 [Modestobacter caceresii]|uniref:Uncharacterized protein n=1 Tax=Modestobacter caceresii TaxID=1522368 RepID=A0A098YCL1_9ACTN|nr:hypothetical protein [Modestobacter caceresii]KGH48177.1 hypothetical protein IN07_03755 [Modestobacter caceresii]
MTTSPRRRGRGEPLAALLRHCELYQGDRHIAEEFDAVEDESASDEDAATLRRYRRARMKAPGFARGSYEVNSHRRIPADVLRSLTEAPATRKQRACAACGVGFVSLRSDARYCSTACRVRTHRRATLLAA